jgi:hypothetical protein
VAEEVGKTPRSCEFSRVSDAPLEDVYNLIPTDLTQPRRRVVVWNCVISEAPQDSIEIFA